MGCNYRVVLRGKVIALSYDIGKEEKSKIKDLYFHLQTVEKEQIKPKIMIREEINDTEKRKIIEKINQKNCFFEEIGQIDKPLES